MLRSIAHRQLTSISRCSSRRSFVSTVLLSKSYEEKTVAELRNEAKKRGLSSSGNKASLISRIMQQDARQTSSPAAAQPQSVSSPPASRRSVSSTPAARAEVASNEAANFQLGVRLPDLSQPPPESPVQVPFVPDFWESSKVHAEEAKAAEADANVMEDVPKIIVAADVSTHPLGGPSHNLYPGSLAGAGAARINEFSSSSTEVHNKPKKEGLVADAFEDIGVPLSELTRAARTLGSISTSTSSDPDADAQSKRPLESGERRGLWVLLGATIGAWGVSHVVSPSQKH